MGRGTHLSGRILTARVQLRNAQDTAGHATRDRREALEEFFQAIIVFQALEQRLDRNARVFEDEIRRALRFRGEMSIWEEVGLRLRAIESIHRPLRRVRRKLRVRRCRVRRLT